MTLRSTILWATAIVIVGVVNYGVFQKERLRTTGRPVYLELAPVDPRSLIQGDYMILDYALFRSLDMADVPNSGQLRLTLNEQQVATKASVFDGEPSLTDSQLLINFKNDNGWRLRIGADNYFFQEGQGETFAEAEYAEVRVGPNGELILVGLLDGELNPIRNKTPD